MQGCMAMHPAFDRASPHGGQPPFKGHIAMCLYMIASSGAGIRSLAERFQISCRGAWQCTLHSKGPRASDGNRFSRAHCHVPLHQRPQALRTPFVAPSPPLRLFVSSSLSLFVSPQTPSALRRFVALYSPTPPPTPAIRAWEAALQAAVRPVEGPARD